MQCGKDGQSMVSKPHQGIICALCVCLVKKISSFFSTFLDRILFFKGKDRRKTRVMARGKSQTKTGEGKVANVNRQVAPRRTRRYKTKVK